MKRVLVCLAAAALVVAPAAAPAWEAATTHAGLTEQAALASALHERLARDFGLERGLYEMLEMPPADAPELTALLRQFSPSDGFSPDARGRQSALGWLVAGAAVADSPAAHFANHFFDPRGRHGLRGGDLGGAVARLRLRLAGAMSGGALPRSGVSALDWLTDSKNPMNLSGFWEQYDKAVLARTPGERGRHLAGALTAAGALLHIIEDMASPSHVRNDLAAHAEPLSDVTGDRGSRFERLAALAYGRLGVPAPTALPSARPLRALITAADRSGLADRTATGYLSSHTLPAPRSIERGARRLSTAELGLPASMGGPEASGGIDLAAAATGGGALRDERGVCLARYQLVDGQLGFAIDDACALEQIAALLPEAAGYAAVALDTLFRGSLTLSVDGRQLAASAGPLALGAGTLVVLWDDAAGVRTELARLEVSGGAAGAVLGRVPAPPVDAVRVSALFRGVDASNEPLSAAGSLPLR
jgi:hypothetical protein